VTVPLRIMKRMTGCEQGAFLPIFALALPVVMGATGIVVDYSTMSQTKNRLQAVADSTALAAAREFRVGTASARTMQQVAEAYARGSLPDLASRLTIQPTVDLENRQITVQIGTTVPTYVMQLAQKDAASVRATATARMMGSTTPICVIGLNETRKHSVELDQKARLEANGCAVYSNSKHRQGLIARDDAVVRAGLICSAGGKAAFGKGEFLPAPRTDCPVMPDPLIRRQLPVAGGCTHTRMRVRGGSVTLSPGTYCEGLRIEDGARVTLQPGIYVFKDGPLRVDDKSKLDGVNVALHFVGEDARLHFRPQSSISLTAPRSGSMAGILISEDRSGEREEHEILSNDAGMLLGTIYLPRSDLIVGSSRPVAEKSAFTIIIANRFGLSEGPTMVLNTNYGATDIPVPDGVGPNGSRPTLVH
jgi:Flp pilus assembly protein TadG